MTCQKTFSYDEIPLFLRIKHPLKEDNVLFFTLPLHFFEHAQNVFLATTPSNGYSRNTDIFLGSCLNNNNLLSDV